LFANLKTPQAAKVALVALVIGLVLSLDALASSSVLHVRICPNANQPGHHCAVTAFMSGVAGTCSSPALMVVLWVVGFAGVLRADTVFRVVPLFRLSPSRPPPFSLRHSR
jgi:hypothetical protein